MTPCKLSKQLECFCETFFELEKRSKNKWRILETSFTDVIIAAFSHYSFAQVNVDASIEAKTSADIEVLFFLNNGRSIRYLLQSKRSKQNYSNGNPTSWSYPHLFHKFTSSKTKKSIYQVSNLIDYSAKNRCIPLYCFYHSKTAASDLGTSGIELLPAKHVEDQLKEVTKKILLCKHYVANSYPFHDLFCKTLSSATDTDAMRDDISDNDLGDWLNFRGRFRENPGSTARMLIRQRLYFRTKLSHSPPCD